MDAVHPEIVEQRLRDAGCSADELALRRRQRDAPDPAWKRLSPGIYSDGDTMHVYPAELLEAAGIEVTPESLAASGMAIARAFDELGPEFGLPSPKIV